MDTTNPVAEVAPQGPAQPDTRSPEDRLANLFGEGSKPAPKAKAADPEQEQEDEAAEDGSEGDEPDDGDAVSNDDAAADEGDEQDAANTAEIEVDGKTYVVPKELEPAFLKSKDYTHKTQELAERRRLVDERERFIDQTDKSRAAIFDKAVEVRALAGQLERFKALDWDALANQGGSEYLNLDRTYRNLQQQHADAIAEAQRIVAAQQQQSAEQRQQLRQRGTEELAREIKGWNADLGRQLFDNAKHYGFQDQELEQVLDPRYVKVLHDAYQWRQLQTSKAQLKKKVEQAKPVTVKAARTAQNNQAAQLDEAARARLKKSGTPRDAEEALFRIFERKRKR